MADDGREIGSTLLLVPSAVLVLFMLTALAVDGAATFLAQRELADACAGAANDAAVMALEADPLYASAAGTTPSVDPGQAATIARSRVQALESRWGRVGVHAEIVGPEIVLHLGADPPLPIGPGGSARNRTHVSASCRATTVRR